MITNIEHPFNTLVTLRASDYYNCAHKTQIVINVFLFSKGLDVSTFAFSIRLFLNLALVSIVPMC